MDACAKIDPFVSTKVVNRAIVTDVTGLLGYDRWCGGCLPGTGGVAVGGIVRPGNRDLPVSAGGTVPARCHPPHTSLLRGTQEEVTGTYAGPDYS